MSRSSSGRKANRTAEVAYVPHVPQVGNTSARRNLQPATSTIAAE